MASPEFRHPTEDDIEVIVDLINTSNRDNPLWDVRNPEEFRKNTFEHDDWEAEGHWLAVLEGEVAGYGGGWVSKRRIEAGKNEGWVGFWVLPDYRGTGIEEALLERAIEHVRQKRVAEARHFDLAGTYWRLTVVEKFGFKEVKHEYILVNKSPGVETPKHPKGLEYEEFMLENTTKDQLERFMEVSNRSFSEDREFTPLTMEFLEKWKDSTQDVHRILFAKLGGDIVGVCLSTIELEYNKLHNVNSGWIGVFGVLKEHRRKGIGKALLVNGIKWLQDRGTDIIYLGVDETNPKALKLYESAGFEIEQEAVTYGLAL